MLDLSELYNESWSRNHGDNATKETVEFWNKQAEAMESAYDTDPIPLLSKLGIAKCKTILDIGAGIGSYAITMAALRYKVTALDFSPKMLEVLRKRAALQKVDITTIEGRWLDVELKEKFDAIFCFNSLGVISCDENHKSHLIRTLKKIKNTASKYIAILIPHADAPLDDKMRSILELDGFTHERRRIAVLYFAMVECGMLPSLNILKNPFTWTFSSLREGVNTLLAKSGITACSDEKKLELENYLGTLTKQNKKGMYLYTHMAKQALYTYAF